MLDLAHIGERIRECRKKKMMTIRVLGEYTGLSAGYLSMLEQNKTSPNVDSLARICEALDIDIQYALEGEIPGKTVIRREEMSKHLYPEENITVEVADFGQGESIFEYITIGPGESAKKRRISSCLFGNVYGDKRNSECRGGRRNLQFTSGRQCIYKEQRAS